MRLRCFDAGLGALIRGFELMVVYHDSMLSLGVAGSFIQVFGRYAGVLSQSVGGLGAFIKVYRMRPRPPSPTSRRMQLQGWCLVQGLRWFMRSLLGFVPAF